MTFIRRTLRRVRWRATENKRDDMEFRFAVPVAAVVVSSFDAYSGADEICAARSHAHK